MTPGSLFTEADRAKLNLINAQLAQVVYLAAQTSLVGLRVTEGMRTPTRQAELVRKGASKTLDSRHLTGHAVDLAPMVDGELRWDWPLFYPMASVMRYAAIKLDVPIRWGGVWDRALKDLPESAEGIEGAVLEYVIREKERQRKAGKKNPSVLIDGPHFEIPLAAPGFE